MKEGGKSLKMGCIPRPRILVPGARSNHVPLLELMLSLKNDLERGKWGGFFLKTSSLDLQWCHFCTITLKYCDAVCV